MAKLYAEIPAAFRRLCVETGVTGPMVTIVPAQPPLGGCVLKLSPCHKFAHNKMPAAFRRLCVETRITLVVGGQESQPPLGGCVLKQTVTVKLRNMNAQPPLGGCVLKRSIRYPSATDVFQPPLGGCVLKHIIKLAKVIIPSPAAFRRLCVETTTVYVEFPFARASRL